MRQYFAWVQQNFNHIIGIICDNLPRPWDYVNQINYLN